MYRSMRAVDGNIGHSLQHWQREIEEEKRRPTIPCARVTRDLGRPSLDAHSVIDLDTPDKVQCACSVELSPIV